MNPALLPHEWAHGGYLRGSGRQALVPPYRSADGCVVGRHELVEPGELMAAVALCNEALHRLGEPCFTREMVGALRRATIPAGLDTELLLAAAADLIESILPPEGTT